MQDIFIHVFYISFMYCPCAKTKLKNACVIQNNGYRLHRYTERMYSIYCSCNILHTIESIWIILLILNYGIRIQLNAFDKVTKKSKDQLNYPYITHTNQVIIT